MIVDWVRLQDFAGTVAMVDGSFDPLHDGHIAYFAKAAEFGLPILCNIASDSWTATKHPVLLPQKIRAIVVDSIRHVDFVHCATVSTQEVLARAKPAMYLKGADWLIRGGIPTEEAAICRQLDIEVRYLDTVLNSSSQLITRFHQKQ
jgi:bifunctional ADP-heptose synthase (sugar kinase/adenylyltransferase)